MYFYTVSRSGACDASGCATRKNWVHSMSHLQSMTGAWRKVCLGQSRPEDSNRCSISNLTAPKRVVAIVECRGLGVG